MTALPSEIVTLIVSSIPLWVFTEPDKPKFQPQDLFRLSLVSKTWHDIIMRILWCSFSSEAMSNVPARLKEKQSIHFRHLFLSKEDNVVSEPWEFMSEHILSLSMVSWDQMGLQLIKRLNQQGKLRALTHLNWIDVDYDRFSSEVRMVFRCLKPYLKTLRLRDWQVRFESLLEQLAVLQTLQFLVLDRIDWCSPTYHLMPSFHPTDAKGETLLPIKVLELNYINDGTDRSCKALERFLRSCPELERLVIRNHPNDHIGPGGITMLANLIEKMPQASPHLRRLELYVKDDRSTTTSYVATFTSPTSSSFSFSSSFSSSSHAYSYSSRLTPSGAATTILTGLDASIPILEEHLLRLVAKHASTLESLRIRCFQSGLESPSLEISCIIKILALPLVNLRELQFKQQNPLSVTAAGMLGQTLLKRTWGCVHLETLSLEGWWYSPEDDQGHRINTATSTGAASITSSSANDHDDNNNDAAQKPQRWQPAQNDRTAHGVRLLHALSQQLVNLPLLQNLSLNGVDFEKL